MCNNKTFKVAGWMTGWVSGLMQVA